MDDVGPRFVIGGWILPGSRKISPSTFLLTPDTRTKCRSQCQKRVGIRPFCPQLLLDLVHEYVLALSITEWVSFFCISKIRVFPMLRDSLAVNISAFEMLNWRMKCCMWTNKKTLLFQAGYFLKPTVPQRIFNYYIKRICTYIQSYSRNICSCVSCINKKSLHCS